MTITADVNLAASLPQLPDVDTCAEYAYDGSSAETATTDRITVVAGQSYTFGPYAQVFNADGAQCQLDALLYDTDIAYVPGIVTDGLVAHWQAERASSGTAPGSGSLATWKNLVSGAGDGTLTAFDFDAADGWRGDGTLADPYRLLFDSTSGDYVSGPDLGTTTAEDKTFTYEVWWNSTHTALAYSAIMGEANPGVTAWGAHVLTYAGYLYCGYVDASVTGYWNSTLVLVNDGEWHHVGMVASGATFSVYADGAWVQTGISGPAGTPVITWSGLGIWPYNGVLCDGSIACARIYSRDLSLAELQQNEAAGPLAPYPGIVRTVNLATLAANGGWERHVKTITPAAPEDSVALRLTFSPT